MNHKEANNQFRALHAEVLGAHALLLKKHWNLGEVTKKVSAPVADVNPEDMANYMMARIEASEAHLTWSNAQLKYFKYMEEMKTTSWN
jgi:hypothetical protein